MKGRGKGGGRAKPPILVFPRGPAARHSIIRAMFLKAGALSLALLLASRLLGLLRESAQAAAFGTTGLADVAVLKRLNYEPEATMVATIGLLNILQQRCEEPEGHRAPSRDEVITCTGTPVAIGLPSTLTSPSRHRHAAPTASSTHRTWPRRLRVFERRSPRPAGAVTESWSWAVTARS